MMNPPTSKKSSPSSKNNIQYQPLIHSEVKEGVSHFQKLLKQEQEDWQRELVLYEREEDFEEEEGNRFPYCEELAALVSEEEEDEDAAIVSLFSGLLPTYRRHEILRNSIGFLDVWERNLLNENTKKKTTVSKEAISMDVLFRLLRYSASDICYDFVLARAALLLLWEYRYIHDSLEDESLSRLLVVLKMNYIYNCPRSCNPDEEEEFIHHDCHSMEKFYNSTLTSFLMSLPRKSPILSSFVLWEYDLMSYAASLLEQQILQRVENASQETIPVENRQKLWIQQKLYLMRHEDTEEESGDEDRDATEERFCFKMVLAIVRSLRDERAVPVLVDIAEHTVRRLASNPSNQIIGAEIIASLLNVYLPQGSTSFPCVTDVTRYADLVLSGAPKFDVPSDVVDVVRALYYREMVSINLVKCGYGDFIRWCRVVEAVHPYDPLLFDHSVNYLELNAVYKDENGKYLSTNSISALYDFSLTLLIRTFQLPWKPQTHFTFQPSFQKAVYALALSLHRHRIPPDISTYINSFLPRHWFSSNGDDRCICWCYPCQQRQFSFSLIQKIAFRENKKSLPTAFWKKIPNTQGLASCPKCHVPLFHSSQHLDSVFKDGHRKQCGLPPFRNPKVEEAMLCKSLLQYNRHWKSLFMELFPNCSFDIDQEEHEEEQMQTNYIEEDEDDDDDDWESVTSEEIQLEKEQTATGIITRYFEEKTYKFLKQEKLPFASFYA